MLGIGEIAVRAQQVGQAAHLAPAHRVGLASQRERAGAGLADLPGGQVQVDQRGVLVGAAGALVQALAIKRQGGVRLREPARGLHDVGFDEAGDARGLLRRAVAYRVAQRLEAAGVRGDVGRVDPAFPQHDVQQAVEEGHIGARQQLQVQVGHLGGFGAPRVDDDQLHRRVGAACVLQPAEQDRVRVSGVAAGDEHRLRVVQVVVAGGRRVGAERGLVAGHRAAHAQTRVGVEVVGADQALGQLVEDVVVLGEQLAGDVEADRVGAVLPHDGGKTVSGVVERVVPVDGLRRIAAVRAAHRPQQPRLQRHGLRGREVQRAALGAQPSEVGRMLRVAAHAGDLFVIAFDDDAAADATVRAGRTGLSHLSGVEVFVRWTQWLQQVPRLSARCTQCFSGTTPTCGRCASPMSRACCSKPLFFQKKAPGIVVGITST